MDLSEFSDAFFEEADELLVDMESYLLEIDLEQPDPEQMNAIFRAAHSIKGGAGTFGFTVLQETTHLLENLLDDARKGELSLTRKIVDTFLETKDMLKEQLDAYRNGTAPDQQEFENLCQVLQKIAEENKAGAGSVVSAPEPVKPVEDEKKPVPADEGFELFAESPANGKRMQIRLLNVDEKDRGLIIEELAQLGKVVSSDGGDEQFDILVETEESTSDLEAVLCFVIDTDQLVITAVESSGAADGEQEPEAVSGGVEFASEVSAVERAGNEESLVSAQEQEDEQADDDTDEQPVPKNALKAGADAGKANGGAGAKAKTKAAGESSTIRVAVDKVDQVINLVGELIITQSMLNETVSGLDVVNHADLLNGVNLLQRNARDLQTAVMSIRMLPMDYVFSRFPRLVRDLAGKLGKEIELITEGESTELDKGLTERIIDPLTHLVRNSLDHGIELPEVREAAGKSRKGKLVLSAQHQGGNILIEVRDDGAGLNRDKILAKAMSSGIQVSENMPDEEVWQLIFAPGLSTAEQVSDLSGRGVGMDVVKRNIQSMGGHVEIMSRPGGGTTTRIVLPLTLAILDGMLIKVGEEIYILPVSSIIESLQLRDENLSYLPGNIPMLRVRSEHYTVVSIADAMGMKSQASNSAVEKERKTAVMVQGGNVKYVMLVDELLGQQQVVVKNLEANYRKIEGVSAATILGDGSVALILDIPDLYRLGQRKKSRPAELKNNSGKREQSANEKPEPVDSVVEA